MTVIQKKRKYESQQQQRTEAAEDFGQKYHCDSCQLDITALVRIRCAECPDFDLCVDCFGNGVELNSHKNSHPYRVMEMLLDFTLFDQSWGADEELLLVEGLDIFGIGNWDQISEHIQTKNKNQCEQHYQEIYIQSENWPYPTFSKKFQGSERLSAKDRTIPPPKLKIPQVMSSQPGNHEIQGFMPGRMEFDAEFDNDAEQAIKDLVFEDCESNEDVQFKAQVLNVYNTTLDRRIERKKFMYDRKLFNFRQIQATEKKK